MTTNADDAATQRLAWRYRLRLWWISRLYSRSHRLEAKAYRLTTKSDDCATYASRHLRKLREAGVDV